MSSLNLWKRAYERYQLEGVRGLASTAVSFIRRLFRIYTLYVHILLNFTVGIVRREGLRNRQRTWEFSEPATVEISLPDTSSAEMEPPKRLQTYAGSYARDQPFVTEVSNVCLIGPKAVPVSKDGVILEAFSSRRDRLEEHLLSDKQTFWELIRYNRSTNREFDTVCSFASVGTGYCEWIQSVLTRLEGLEEYTEQTGNRPRLLLPADPAPWMIETIEFFGYTEDDWTVWDGQQTVVDNFVVPSVRTGEYDGSYYSAKLSHDDPLRVIHPGACEWLQNEALRQINNNATTATGNRLYISRENAEDRQVHNRDEIQSLLSAEKFRLESMEMLPFSEQVSAISDANIIVAPHGAGLVNIIFSPETTVVELFGAKVKSTYFLLSETLGHDYRYLLCDDLDNDIYININNLARILEDSSSEEEGS